MKPSKILIIHGWEADNQANWFPQAKSYFENKNYEVIVPNFPGEYFPKLDEWLEIIESFSPDENWILVGHSLGGVAIMRYLEKAGKPVAQTVLTATPIDEMQFTPLKNFFMQDFDWEKIRQNAGKINLIYEEGDEVVPLEHGKILSQKLVAPLEIVPGAWHLYKLDMGTLDKIII